MAESPQFHLSYRGQQLGPMDLRSVNIALLNGEVGADAMAWYKGLEAWIPISQIEGVLLSSAASAKLPPSPPAFYPNVSNQSPKSKIGYILLGVFLGNFGIHNFYAGYIGQGIAQLLISVFLFWTIIAIPIVWIWAIVNVCTVESDARGRPFST